MQDKIKRYFDNRDEETRVYSTADGFLFPKKEDAEAHAASLKDRTVTLHKRENKDQAPITIGKGTENQEGDDTKTPTDNSQPTTVNRKTKTENAQ